MPLEDYIKKDSDKSAEDTLGDKVLRELELVGVGVSAIPGAASDAFTERPGETALKLASAAGLAFALRYSLSKAGPLKGLAQSVGVGVGVSTIADFGRNVGPVAGALADNFESPHNFDRNAQIMREHFAPFVVDSALTIGVSIGAGHGGARYGRYKDFEPILPKFTTQGLLPAGIHPATWQEFSQRYGGSPRRQALLANMESLLQQCRSQSGTPDKVYIGGSFVSTKSAPKDFDMTWRISGQQYVQLQKTAPLLVERSLQLKELGGQLMVTYPNSPGDGVLGFLQHNRRLNVPVGVVELDLSTLPSPTSYRLRSWLGTAGPRPITESTKLDTASTD